MRSAFVRALVELAAQDERILLLTGDLGYLALEPFIEAYPTRFFNCGVAEQNMVGMATGLAEAGFIPFVYSIVNFSVMRPFEFIRNGAVLHNLPVRVVGVGGGMAYGTNGATHYGLEDIALMRTQPTLTVIAPADRDQTGPALRATWNQPGPVFYRLGKDDRALVPGLDGRFEDGGLQVVRRGSDLTLLTVGSTAFETVRAADLLAEKGLEAQVVVVSQLNPTPPGLQALLAPFKLALTVEAHYITGGLGSLAAEVIADGGLGTRLVRCGVRSLPDGRTGSQAYLFHRHGMDGNSVAQAALAALQKGSANAA